MTTVSQSAMLRVVVAATFLTVCRIPLEGQFNTPSVDGVVQPGEYGNTQNGTNQIGTNTATWYMTWDASNLYVAIAGANLGEAAVIYIDANPVNPPSGGGNTNGNVSGFNYDREEIGTLPFRAQFVTYFKNGYNEYRKADGNGNWTNQVSNYGTYASNGTGNVREFAIPWLTITGGGMPSSFLFLGLLTSNGGYVYGQVPNDNSGTVIGTSATYTRYFVVNNTANDSRTPPFSIENSSNTVNFAALYHNTFDPYYRSQEGAVPAGSTVTLRLRTAHFGATGVILRAYLFDAASGKTNGPVDLPMTFLQNTTVNGTLYDEYTIDYATPTTPTVAYYKFMVSNGSGVA
ncbi:MAG TPA: hypothetical protein VG168_08975, partial [Bryobacteraceae bacterium]|nr:hypothetical protein [Bryobacteraceae bacterium]